LPRAGALPTRVPWGITCSEGSLDGSTPRRSSLYARIWRWHFFAGLWVAPFGILLALSGSVYLWNPQIEALLQRRMDAGGALGAALPEDRLVAAALVEVGGGRLPAYRRPGPDEATARIEVVSAAGVRTLVWVERSSARPVHVMDFSSHPMEIARQVHGELMTGRFGSTLVELAACWMIVLLVSGAYLAWPRRRGWLGVLLPRFELRSRPGLRGLHAAGGLGVGGLVLVFLVSGLPWTDNFGSLFKRVQDLIGSRGPGQEFVVTLQSGAPPTAPGGEELWKTHEHHDAPAVDVASAPPSPTAEPILLAAIAASAVREDLPAPVDIAPPQGENGVWTVRSLVQRRPDRVTIHYDRWTGEERMRIAFGDYPALQRAVSYGIAFHEGQLFGIANQILGMCIAFGVVGLSLSGLVMWWRRRPEGALGAPPLPADRRLGYGVGVLIAAFALLLPLVGASLVLVLALESLWGRLGPRPAPARSLSSRA